MTHIHIHLHDRKSRDQSVEYRGFVIKKEGGSYKVYTKSGNYMTSAESVEEAKSRIDRVAKLQS